jgi:hypothetical protein
LHICHIQVWSHGKPALRLLAMPLGWLIPDHASRLGTAPQGEGACRLRSTLGRSRWRQWHWRRSLGRWRWWRRHWRRVFIPYALAVVPIARLYVPKLMS